MQNLSEMSEVCLWKLAVEACGREDDGSVSNEQIWQLVHLLLLSLGQFAPDYKRIVFSPEQKADRDARVRDAFSKIPQLDGSWTVVEFFEMLKSSATGEYLFHTKQQADAVESKPSTGVPAAFDSTEFQDSGAIKELARRIRLFASTWNGDLKYYAPYFPVLNASMTGKSRMISELPSREGIFTFPVCLRLETHADYRPPRSGRLADWATKEEKDPIKFTRESCAFLEISLRMFKDWLLRLPQLTAQPNSSPYTKKSLKELAVDWDEYLKMHANTIWEPLAAEVRASSQDVTLQSTLSSTVLDIVKLSSARLSLLVNEVTSAFEAHSSDYSSSGESQPVFVYVIDEASQLKLESPSFNGLTLFRRALSGIPRGERRQGCLLFCLLTDTVSKVSNFSPASELGESLRLINGARLFPPFTVVDTVDVWADKARSTKVTDTRDTTRTLYQIRNACFSDERMRNKEAQAGEKNQAAVVVQDALTVDLIESYEFMATFGRAGLYAHLIGIDAMPLDQGGPAKVHDLMMTKLLRRIPGATATETIVRRVPDDDEVPNFADKDRQNSLTSDRLPYTQTEVVGALGAIASIDVCAGTVMAADVSAGHMRLIYGISKLRKDVYTFEVSEPVLALAGHELIGNYIGWRTVLSKFVATQLNGATQLGIRGEHGFQFLVLMAYQECMGFSFSKRLPVSLSFPCIRLTEFLERFFGETMHKVSKTTQTAWSHMKESLKDAVVRPNQFVRTEEAPSLEMAYEHFLRGTVVWCKNNQKAIDFFFPFHNLDDKMGLPRLPREFNISNKLLVADVHESIDQNCSKDLQPNRGMVGNSIKHDRRDGSSSAFITKSGINFFIAQIKVGQDCTTISQKAKFMNSVDKVGDIQNQSHPSVLLLCEFKNNTSAEQFVHPSKVAGSSTGMFNRVKTRVSRHIQNNKLCPLVIRCQRLRSNDRFVVFLRDLRPSHILTGNADEIAQIDDEFSRLIEPQRKILMNKNIDSMDLPQLRNMCRTQPCGFKFSKNLD